MRFGSIIWFLVGTFAGWVILTFIGIAAGLSAAALITVFLAAFPVFAVIGLIWFLWFIFHKRDKD